MLPTSRDHIFVDHNPEAPPPHPGPSYTRFVCISDTHSRWFPIPAGDVLVHAGDLSSWGNVAQLKKTIDWLKTLPHPIKIIIAGNHDLCLDPDWTAEFDPDALGAARNLVRDASAQQAGLCYLEHDSMEFTTAQGQRWKVYGSPAAPRYASGAFQYTPGPEGRVLYARIPADTDILLTHTPPYQIHDLTKKGKHAGCKDLAARLQDLETGSDSKPGISNHKLHIKSGISTTVSPRVIDWKCRLHVWGHIHEAYGASIKSHPNCGTVQVNAALAWDRPPIIVDLLNEHGTASLTSEPSIESTACN